MIHPAWRTTGPRNRWGLGKLPAEPATQIDAIEPLCPRNYWFSAEKFKIGVSQHPLANLASASERVLCSLASPTSHIDLSRTPGFLRSSLSASRRSRLGRGNLAKITSLWVADPTQFRRCAVRCRIRRRLTI